eukprot:427423-Hanusia_phi.AAC.1
MFAYPALPSTTARLRLHVPLTVTLTLTSVTDYSAGQVPSGIVTDSGRPPRPQPVTVTKPGIRVYPGTRSTRATVTLRAPAGPGGLGPARPGPGRAGR